MEDDTVSVDIPYLIMVVIVGWCYPVRLFRRDTGGEIPLMFWGTTHEFVSEMRT